MVKIWYNIIRYLLYKERTILSKNYIKYKEDIFMYENLFWLGDGMINGNRACVHIKPNFHGEITTTLDPKKFYSNGSINFEPEEMNGLGRTTTHYIVSVSDETDWLLEDEGYCYHLYVIERTKEISTSFGEEFDRQLNKLFKEAKRKYYQKKQEEIRLYFYDAKKDWLVLCQVTEKRNHYGLKYRLERYEFHSKSAIDKSCEKPTSDCFILGRIKRTIGLKYYKLLDFIEPVYTIYPDFYLENNNIWDRDEYRANLVDLEFALEELLSFTIKKEYSEKDVACRRVAAYQHKEKADIAAFNKEIQQTFKAGYVPKIRQLYYVLTEQMDCSNEKFELRLKKSEEVSCTRFMSIYYENGESDIRPAIWIFKNIDRCTDSTGRYLGSLRDTYEFSAI